MWKGRRIGAGALAMLLVVGIRPGESLAHPGFPDAESVAPHPTDPNRLMVRANYGVLLTNDRGKNWRWVCPTAIGYRTEDAAPIAILAGGTLLVGTFHGPAISYDGGCAWSHPDGELGLKGRLVQNIYVDPASPSRALVLVSGAPDASGIYLNQIWETRDDGHNFTLLSDLGSGFYCLSLESAPNDPRTIYLTSLTAAGPDGTESGDPTTLIRSTDGGASFTRVPIPGTGANLPAYVVGVDPRDARVVYAALRPRASGDGATLSDLLWVTRNGGDTWQEVTRAQGQLSGFAISPDGASVAIGGVVDGLQFAASDGLSFQLAPGRGDRAMLQAHCLSWNRTGMHVCADYFSDGFELGRTSDLALSFEMLLVRHDAVRGPLECPVETTAGGLCPAAWSKTCGQMAGLCTPAGGGASGMVDAGNDPRTSEPAPVSAEAGCGCTAHGSRRASFATLLIAIGLVLARRRGRLFS